VNNYLFPFQGHPPSLDLPGLRKQALNDLPHALLASPSDIETHRHSEAHRPTTDIRTHRQTTLVGSCAARRRHNGSVLSSASTSEPP
jgi:hypothetical protein